MNQETLKLSQEEERFFKEAIDEIVKNRKPQKQRDVLIICCALRMNKALEALELLLSNKLVHEAYSALRNLFETMIMQVAAWKSQDFENLAKRLHANYLVDQLDLINALLESNHHSEFESLEETIARGKKIRGELAELKSKEIRPLPKNPTDSLATLANLSKFKRHFYKLMSLYTHPNLHSIEKFMKQSKENGAVQLVKDFENDSEEGIRECVYNFLRISNSILNTTFSLGFDRIVPEELLNTAENTFKDVSGY